MKSKPQRIEALLDLHLPLMALFNAMVPMPSDHNILIPIEDATSGLQVECIYMSNEDFFSLFRG